MVFLIAVDDEALRRHLIAKEFRDSGRGNGVEARQYVDEYLAKFFSTSLPIRPLLPYDMRVYVERHLADFLKGRVAKENRKRLVELVASGLRRNPRRVKQFANDFELRLRLIHEREQPSEGTSAAIDLPIGDEILMIAKLLLVEGEWPTRFEKLQHDPSLLQHWHRQAESSDFISTTRDENEQAAKPDKQPKRPAGNESDQDFASFLRATRSIKSKRLLAILRLKQSAQEVSLPNYTDFREALLTSDREQVREILAESEPEQRRGYAAALEAILDEEVRTGFTDGALGVVDSALTVFKAKDYATERTAVLDKAIVSPALKDSLGLLDPASLLGAAQELGESKRGEAEDLVIRNFANPSESEDSRTAAAKALAPFLTDLPERKRELIRDALATMETVGNFPPYIPIAEADPSVLPPEVTQQALQAVVQPDSEGRANLHENEDAFRVLVAAIAGSSNPDVEGKAVSHIVQALSALEADPQPLGKTIAGAKRLLGISSAASPERYLSVAEHIRQRWGLYPPELRPDLLVLAADALEKAPEEKRSTTASTLASELFSDPGAGTACLLQATPFPEILGESVATHLVSLVSDQPAHRDNAVQVLRKIDPDAAPKRLADAAVKAFQRGHYDGATELLREDDVSTAGGSETAQHLLDRTRELVRKQTPVPLNAVTLEDVPYVVELRQRPTVER